MGAVELGKYVAAAASETSWNFAGSNLATEISWLVWMIDTSTDAAEEARARTALQDALGILRGGL